MGEGRWQRGRNKSSRPGKARWGYPRPAWEPENTGRTTINPKKVEIGKLLPRMNIRYKSTLAKGNKEDKIILDCFFLVRHQVNRSTMNPWHKDFRMKDKISLNACLSKCIRLSAQSPSELGIWNPRKYKMQLTLSKPLVQAQDWRDD